MFPALEAALPVDDPTHALLQRLRVEHVTMTELDALLDAAGGPRPGSALAPPPRLAALEVGTAPRIDDVTRDPRFYAGIDRNSGLKVLAQSRKAPLGEPGQPS